MKRKFHGRGHRLGKRPRLGALGGLSSLGSLAAQAAANKIGSWWKAARARKTAAATRPRARRSFTSTRTVTKKRGTLVSTQHNDESQSWLRFTMHKPVKYYHKAAMLKYTNMARGLFKNTEGFQYCGTLFDLLNRTQFVTNSGVAGSGNVGAFDFTSGLFNMNPNQRATGDTGEVGGIGNTIFTPLTGKVHVRSITGHVDFINGSNISAELFFFVYGPLRSVYDTPYITWYTEVARSAAGIGIGPETQGMTQVSTLASETANDAKEGFALFNNNAVTYGLFPSSCKTFGKFFKTWRVRKIVLQPGQTHRMKVSIGVNTTYAKETMFEDAAIYQKGMLSTMVIVKPQAVFLANTALSQAIGAADDVTYGVTNIGWISNLTYHCVYPNPTQQVPETRIRSNVPQATIAQHGETITNITDTVRAVVTQN